VVVTWRWPRQFPDFHDVDAGIEQEGGGSGAKRTERVNAFHDLAAFWQNGKA
jgi:hypothetical protein